MNWAAIYTNNGPQFTPDGSKVSMLKKGHLLYLSCSALHCILHPYPDNASPEFSPKLSQRITPLLTQSISSTSTEGEGDLPQGGSSSAKHTLLKGDLHSHALNRTRLGSVEQVGMPESRRLISLQIRLALYCNEPHKRSGYKFPGDSGFFLPSVHVVSLPSTYMETTYLT